MAAQKNTFVLRLDVMRITKALPDADLAALIRAVITAAEGMEAVPPDAEPARTLYELIRGQMEADRQKYAERCEKNRENIRKRYQKQRGPANE